MTTFILGLIIGFLDGMFVHATLEGASKDGMIWYGIIMVTGVNVLLVGGLVIINILL